MSKLTSIESIKIELPSFREKVIPHRKLLFADKLKSLLSDYSQCLIIEITNIGSKQIAEMRKEFGETAHFLFGKNTLIRKIIRDYIKETKNKNYMKLMDLIKGNVGLVFTKNDLNMIRKQIIKTKKQSAAKIGSIAPIDVFLPIGPTNCEPTKTQMFQNMDIETRINRGQIDITSTKHIIKKGSKIGASEVEMLSLLNIKPFYYGINVKSIYENGNIIKDCSFMDMTIDDIANSFYIGVQQIAALCFGLSYPTIISVPHCILNAFKQTMGLSMMLNTYSFKELEDVKKAIKDKIDKPIPSGTVIIDDNNNNNDDDDDETSSECINPFTSSDEESSSED